MYFGPPLGFYEPRAFNDFALIEIPRKLSSIGASSLCNSERVGGSGDVSSALPKDGIQYHYPDAGIGLVYRLVRCDRCLVDLLGTRTDIMNEILEFIFEQDNKVEN